MYEYADDCPLTRDEWLADEDAAEAARLAEIEAEGPTWPDDDVLDDWASQCDEGELEIDDPWICAGAPVWLGMSAAELAAWMPEILRWIDEAGASMFPPVGA